LVDKDSKPTTAWIDVPHVVQAADHAGAVWSHSSTDLNVNVVVIDPQSAIGSHINNEVDVAVVVVSGSGVIQVGADEIRVGAQQAVIIPKGLARSIRCDEGQLAYLTIHRRRAGLWPKATPRT
jgi:mannose-6-phosphate isomerase-like protein (cupin superfamily)